MKVLLLDKRSGTLEAVVEDYEDLYYLSLVIEPGDLLYSWTRRQLKVSRGAGEEKAGRVRVYMGIRVEKLDFHRFMKVLRVHGVVVEAPEFLHAQGSHHTMALAPGARFKLVKSRITVFHERIIEKAVKARFAKKLLVSIDDEEAALAVIRPQGVEVICTVHPGARAREKGSLREQYSSYIRDVGAAVKRVAEEGGFRDIIVVGQQMFVDWVCEELRGLRAVKVYGAVGGLSGVYWFLRSEEAEKVARDVKDVFYSSLVERLLVELAREKGRVAVGEEVEKAATMGAVKTLIVVDTAFFDEAVRGKLKGLLDGLADCGGDVVIVPEESEAGKKLKAMGGVAALLYFPIR